MLDISADQVEDLRPSRELQKMPILEWKLERISMDFVIGLPPTIRGLDSILVVKDQLTKPATSFQLK